MSPTPPQNPDAPFVAHAHDRWLERWLPRLREFNPQLMLVSAGFDAHSEDDMGSMKLSEKDYAWVTEQIKAVADESAGGRIVSLLEGGYVLSALARSVAAHLKVLAGI